MLVQFVLQVSQQEGGHSYMHAYSEPSDGDKCSPEYQNGEMVGRAYLNTS